MTSNELVAEFAFHVAAQTDANERNMPGTGNRHARQYASAIEKLREQGDAGMVALATLLTHPRQDVTTMAASYLLQHGPHEANARRVLEEVATGEGLLAFGATMTLKRWAEGGQAQSPEPDERSAHVGGAQSAPDFVPIQEPPPRRPRPGQPLELPDSLAPH